MSDLQEATPDVVIGNYDYESNKATEDADLSEIEDYEEEDAGKSNSGTAPSAIEAATNDTLAADEKNDTTATTSSSPVKKSVAFINTDKDADGLTPEERRQKEFEEGGGLPPQPDNPDFSKLTPLSPEIIGRQATINIGTIGHVAHGKSTVVKAISGVQTVRFKNELERNITIRLGYANAKIYRCNNPSCKRPGCYKSFRSDKEISPKCEVPGCPGRYVLLRHVSFVDCPGHDILMSTMLSGAAVMDAALLLIAGNESCPQPQTSEHLAAIEIMKLDHIIILQNKVDLMQEDAALLHYKSILKFIQGTAAAGAPVIPISAQLKYNIDAVNEFIVNKIPVPVRDLSVKPRLIVIRSFDVNKPGAEIEELKGGVAGGSILNGVLRLGDEIEIRPGIVEKGDNNEVICRPIRSKIVTLFAENNDLKFAVPGGLIGVGTKVDPTLCRADRLVGQVLGHQGYLPDIYVELEVHCVLLRRLLGVKKEGSKKGIKVEKLTKGEILMVNIGSTTAGARVTGIRADMTKLVLTTPACTEIGEKIALSRRIDKHWRLIGWGTIKSGSTLDPVDY